MAPDFQDFLAEFLVLQVVPFQHKTLVCWDSTELTDPLFCWQWMLTYFIIRSKLPPLFEDHCDPTFVCHALDIGEAQTRIYPNLKALFLFLSLR